MKILNIITCFNEIDYLPYVIDYYRKHNIDVFVLDNFSDDGCYEYLCEHKIEHKRVDTGSAFHLERLQHARIEVMKEKRPDWVIYGDADEFIVGKDLPIDQLIEVAAESEYNVLRARKFEFYYTGEKREKRHPKKQYFYYGESWVETGGITRIHKFDENVRYLADWITLPDTQVGVIPAFVLNYGGTKPKELRQLYLKRRALAWEQGLSPAMGSHMIKQERQGYLWKADELHDVRQFTPLRGFLDE